jgi:hypothetical protein
MSDHADRPDLAPSEADIISPRYPTGSPDLRLADLACVLPGCALVNKQEFWDVIEQARAEAGSSDAEAIAACCRQSRLRRRPSRCGT